MISLLRWLLVLLLTPAVLGAAERLSFNRDIRPILSDNCFACHGFDPKTRKADLRLDTPEGAFAKNSDGVAAIVPGKPELSSMVARMLSTDADEVMPPPESHKKLTRAQVDMLQQWVREGAQYQKHWAFEPPVASVPKTKGVGVIDGFLSDALARHSLRLAPLAAPERVLRRITLDLLGLPPTPAELDSFLAEVKTKGLEAATSALVDQLMLRSQYGEHMARYWLDAARYGDTHGLHLDNERSMWPYRDWVVRAFNENLPFDQFTRWQIAGDLLPSPSTDQLIASGFNRCNVTTSEGGSINEEWIYRYAVDRTETTASVWLGLTAGCAVCHDHKYDPISQREFYQLYAFFNSAADPAMDGNILLTQPILRLSTAEQKQQLEEIEKGLGSTQQKLKAALASMKYEDPALAKNPPQVMTSEQLWWQDGFPAGVTVSADGAPTEIISKEQGQVHSGSKALRRKAKGVAQDYFAGGVNYVLPPNAEFSVQVFIDPQDPPKSIMLQFHTESWNNRGVWGLEGAIPYGQVRTTERVMMGKLPESGKWVELKFPASKLGLKPGTKVTGYAFTQFDGTVTWDELKVSSKVNPVTDPQWSWTAWVKKNQGKRVAELPGDLQPIVRGKKPEDWAADGQRIKDWWLENEYQGGRDLLEKSRSEKLALEAKRKALEDVIPATFVMKDLEQPRDAHIMLRGQYDKPGEKVTRATPAIFPALKPKDEKLPTRLDLADWLTRPEHPLMARVTVNRLWQQFFGTGLVKTSNDFGSQGEPPSHPELLDTLAVQFRESGWNVKQLVKALVTSRAYLQSADMTGQRGAQGLLLDPENRLLWHGPRFRLDGEVLRDQALFVSGLLSPVIGGKGVKPYQPENIWEPVAYSGSNTRFYVQDKGESLYRRSLYTFVKRTAPAPAMTNFDGPSREASCLRRERSNTPMQALQLMNDVQHMEAARNTAQRILLQGPAEDAARLRQLWRSVLCREPSEKEAGILASTLKDHLSRYVKDEAAAQKLITFGESKAEAKLPPATLAAWTLVANLVLNLDEALVK
jgi:hypothetical protein